MPETLFFTIIGFIISLIILIYGHISCRNLPDNVRRLTWKKFSLIAIIPLIFFVYFGKPRISSHSEITYLDELTTDNLNSVESIITFEEDQIRQIERLKKEVGSLRNDLSDLNEYYEFLLHIFCFLVISISITTIGKINKDILKVSESE